MNIIKIRAWDKVREKMYVDILSNMCDKLEGI
jgi:hypothetical protein